MHRTAGWGAMGLGDFDPEQLASYRRCWRERDFILGSTADYRAAGEVDVRLLVRAPVTAAHGSLPSGHFFVDELPAEVTRFLRDFLVST